MRLVMFDAGWGPRAGVLPDSDHVLDLAALVPAAHVSDLDAWLAAGATVHAATRQALHGPGADAGPRHRLDGVHLLCPLRRPGKIICLGLNYRDHAAEIGAEPPRVPLLFAKYTNTLIGPGEDIRLPAVSGAVDYEAELVLVLGRGGRNIPEHEAEACIAAVTCGNDISARDLQMATSQFLPGKTCDTFAPLGPALVTLDELPAWPRLPIRCRVNGELLQDSDTGQLIFGPAETIAYLSRLMTLAPGDIIFTGTPAGVGMGRKPPRYLAAGDRVEVEIEGVGCLGNPVVAG